MPIESLSARANAMDNKRDAKEIRALLATLVQATGSKTYDPPSLGTGVGDTTTVTVAGAVVGDPAHATFTQPLQGIQLTAEVSAANTVSVTFHNRTAGTIDLASGTLTAYVRARGNVLAA